MVGGQYKVWLVSLLPTETPVGLVQSTKVWLVSLTGYLLEQLHGWWAA